MHLKRASLMDCSDLMIFMLECSAINRFLTHLWENEISHLALLQPDLRRCKSIKSFIFS